MKVINTSQNTTFGEKIALADSFWKRFWGLIPKKQLLDDEGLILDPCNSIHMFFMRFPIDVIFVDKNNTIVYLLEDFKPWKFSKIVSNSKYVVELPVRLIKSTNTKIGDKIEII